MKTTQDIQSRIQELQKQIGELKTPKQTPDLMSEMRASDNSDKIKKLEAKLSKLEQQYAKKEEGPAEPKIQSTHGDVEPSLDSSILKNPEEVKASDEEEALSDQNKTNIVAQCIREMVFARRYKQGKIRNWQKNEEMYYGKKLTVETSRANVDLARMQEHVHTVMSKVTDGLTFIFQKRKLSQLKRVEKLNALRSWDAERDNWDIKDTVGKKQAIIYGRAAYVYYADSIDGIYKPHLEPIDIYDLLVDPAGGGYDVEQMLYWGRYGILKSKAELENMRDAEDDAFIKQSLEDLIAGSGNNTESSQEETNKFIRMYGQNTIGKKDLQSDEKYKFWQWFTTYNGTRYVVTLQATAGRAIAIEPLSEMFESNLWPIWTYAAFMDLTEFWTPSYCDYVREIFQTQNVNINQMLDNAEAINKPMRVVNVNAIENLAELKYRRDGLVKTRGEFDANKAIQVINTPSIETPIQVFKVLDAIQEKATGVSAGDKGAEDTRGKVAIYQGNQEATRGRYSLFNKSYSFGYSRFATLYQWGVRENLVKKVAIDIIGPDGIEIEEIKRSDIFRKNDDFRVKVEAANEDKNLAIDKMNAKVTMLENQQKDEIQLPKELRVLNPKKAFEFKARSVGFDSDEVKELMDQSEYVDIELMSEADRDIEAIMQGDNIKPNPSANNEYKQRLTDYLADEKNEMTDTQVRAMIKYISSLQQSIYANEARELMKWKTAMIEKQAETMAENPLASANNPTPDQSPGGLTPQ